jgi:hypothetical protein
VLRELLRALSRRDRDDDVRRKLKPYLRDSDACIILRLVLENPGITPVEIVGRSRIDQTVVEGYLNGMVMDGIAVIEKDGNGVGYHIAGPAKAAVVEHLPLNYQCPGMLRE